MKYFTIDEFVYSVTAKGRNIDNTPTEEHKKNIEELVDNLLDPLREEWEGYCKFNNLGTPAIRVSSGYRSKKLNSAIGGSNTSAHSIGSAADLVPYNGELKHFMPETGR